MEKRRSFLLKGRKISLFILISVFLFSLIVLSNCDLLNLTSPYKIDYLVTGDGPCTITYVDESGAPQLELDVYPTWSYTFNSDSSLHLIQVYAVKASADPSDQITIKVHINNTEVLSQTDDGEDGSIIVGLVDPVTLSSLYSN
ncbi:MAG: hypothetical protein JSV25_04730 [Spirochaetota bacterium]|nr:MAG: hypothetical protein JSV25_04730 [Spirochaetota bacterium]